MNEDVAADAELVRRELIKGGWDVRFTRVETREAFEEQLKSPSLDVILSDHGLPGFDGFAALTMARARCPDVPFIFVTGASGEEITIEAFESGATDYILKGELSKLSTAVGRALQEVRNKHTRRLMEVDRERLIQELHEALQKVKELSGFLSICCCCKKIRDEQDRWKPFEIYFQEHSKLMFSHGYCPDCFARARAEFEASHQ